jgi:hypothetical protein
MNKQWDVKIRAVITKTVRVEADTEDDATEQAHEWFSTACDGNDEDYNEETIGCKRVSNDNP